MHEKSLEIAVEALKSMKFDGDVINVKSFGSGIINVTFLVTCKNNKGNENKYILQKINSSIFKNVEKLKSLGLDVPQVTELAYELRKMGIEISDDVLTVDECFDEIIRILGETKR